MSTPNHTPGPWRIIDSIEQSKATIVGADFPAMGFVADVNLCRNNDKEEVDGAANARLIAAAPELLEALKHALAVCEAETELRGENDTDDYEGGAAGPVAEMIRDAITKAEGRVNNDPH
jgi:hypothetical protein